MTKNKDKNFGMKKISKNAWFFCFFLRIFAPAILQCSLHGGYNF